MAQANNKISHTKVVLKPKQTKKEQGPLSRLPDPGLKQEIAVALKPDARLEEALERVALPVEAVDDLGACGG
jgi:hypothetical protein